MTWNVKDLGERLCHSGRERLAPRPPNALTAITQLDTPKLMGLLSAVRLPVQTLITCTIASHFEELRQAGKHEPVAFGKDRPIASNLLVINFGARVSLGIEAIPKLEVVAGLVDDDLVFRATDGQILLDEAVPAHHHVNGAAEEASEVGNTGVVVLAATSHVKRPEDLTCSMECLETEVRRHVGECSVGLSLRTMLVEGYGVVEHVAHLCQDLELVF